MQADTFPRTSGARNPTVIVKIFIFIFLWLKWYCRINYAREGGAIWRVGPDACKYLIHKKLHTYIYIYIYIYLLAGGAIT